MIRYYTLLLLPLAACATMDAPGQAAATAHAERAPFASDRIGVTVRGEGQDVVLIHGMSSSPEVWDGTVAALPGYRYHLIHVAGMGGRPPGANANGPVVAPVAEEIARYVREAGLQRPAIVGHSLGGSWGMMVAARHPELVGRLMVVDMLPFLGAMFGGSNATAESVRPIAEQIRAGMAGASGAARQATQEQIIATMVQTEALRPLAVRHGMASDMAVSSQAFYDLITTNLIPEVGAIRVPITVLWVRPPNAPVTQEQMAGFYQASYAGIPGARIVNVPNSYHFIMWDAPERFQQELRTFLSGS